MRSLRSLRALAVLVVVSSGLATVDAADRPNIVVILADDLGYGDPACYGGKIPTPHIDRLASQGMRFLDAHTSSAVCSPTRYGLLTGRYNWRSKLQRGVLGGLSPRLIEAERQTIASFLKQQGYHAAAVGKWHLGLDWSVLPGKQVTELNIEPREQVFNVDYAKPFQNGPLSVGFDEYFGISASLDMVPYVFLRNDRVTVPPTEDREFLMMAGRDKGPKTRQGPTAPGFEAEGVLPEIVRESCEIIARQAPKSKESEGGREPFFLYVPLTGPHTPILPTPEWAGKSGMNPYADFVMQTDAAVGAMIGALKEAGVEQDTLVILTSDNGCSPQAKFDELKVHGHNPSGPLRGNKADLFEGGHRVPFVVRWPGRCAAGETSPETICLTDIFATAAEICGEKLADEAAEDSFSFLAALQPGGRTTRDHLVSHSINGSFAIRRGPWKLLLCPDSGGWSEPRPGAKKAQGLMGVQLYNLETDLAESRNVADAEPKRVEELREQLDRIVERGRSTPGRPQKNAVPVDFMARK